jgi:hypothetical protein
MSLAERLMSFGVFAFWAGWNATERMNCFFHPAAEAEYLESVAFYESKQPGLGAACLNELRFLPASR